MRSPIRGRVGRAEVTAGNLVQPGGPMRLTTVVSLDPIYATFDADERSYLKYASRGAGGPRDHRAPILLGTASEGQAFPHEGYVDFFDNQLDPRSGTVRARAVFPNPNHLFAPGLFARLKLVGGAAYQATVVSDRAIGTDQDKKFVLVVKPDSTVEYRPIELGRLVDGYRVVAGGLKAGEKVVVNGLQRVRPGMRVNATAVPMLADAQEPGAAPPSSDPGTPGATTMRFSRFFIDRPIFAAAVSIVIFIAGAIAIFALPVSEYPEVVPPSIVVRAVYPGANPRVLAEAVAAPLEEQINGVENMLYVSSQATSDGALQLTVTFRVGTDVDLAQVQVQNRVSQALAAPARGGAAARRHHRQELAQHHDGRAPGVARQPLRHGVPAQLRRAASEGRAGAHSRAWARW